MEMYWKFDVPFSAETVSIVWFGIFYHADTNSKYKTSQQKRRIKTLNTCIGLYGAVFPLVHHSSFVRFTSYSFIGHSTPSFFFFLSVLCLQDPKLLDNIIGHKKKRSEFSSLLSPVDCGLVNVLFFLLSRWSLSST